MKNSQSELNSKKIRNSLSQLNINRKYHSEDLIILINNLNTNIKFFCQSIRQCVNEGKQNINNKVVSLEIFELIEENLNEFIYTAKDIFKKMKYTQKINLIQQEINDLQNNAKLHKYEMINNKMKLNSENIYLNTKLNNFNNYIEKNNFIKTNNNIIDDNYIHSLCNNSSNSLKINNYIENQINSYSLKKKNNKNYKKINNHISHNKNLSQNKIYGTNYNLRKNSKSHNNNSLNFCEQNNIFHNYNHQYNNLKKIKNSKSANDLRRKILVNKNSLNNTVNPSHYFSSSNVTQSNTYSSKKEILENLNEIISILKELKLINGNIFNKSWEAEKHQKLLNKIYQELNRLIKNIFNENNLNNSKQKSDYLSGNISERTLKEENEQIKFNSKDYNLTYNYKIYNTNNNEDKWLNDNEKYQQIKKVKIYYDNEIKSRDLVIKKLKNELNIKEKNIHNQNIKYNLLLKSKISNSLKEKNIINEDNLSINQMSKMNIEELIENRKKIIELQQKIKTLKNNSVQKKNNSQQLLGKYNELKHAYDLIKMNNEKLKKQNNIFQKKLKNINQMNFVNIQNESFSIISLEEENKISKEAKKIIDEIKNELQIKNESIEKINEELNILKAKEVKLNEEISELNKNKVEYESEEKKLKEEISNSNNELSKLKENISKNQKDYEILKEKYNNNINENKFLQETIDKQKKLLDYQDKEIVSLKSGKKEEINKLSNNDSNINNENDNEDNSFNNNINKEEKKNKKRNNLKQSEQIQIEQDKIVLKYELLKNDYDKLNTTLQQKQKLLDNFSKLTSETSSKTNIDEQILELISEHKKEIDNLTKKYNQNIINLKMNLPLNYSPETHCILIDKKYSKYNLRWFLLTINTAPEKNYENTFWVPEDEIKPMLEQFNKFRTEKELEDEHFESIYITQQKWIKQIDENEQLINKLKAQLQKYELSSSTG